MSCAMAEDRGINSFVHYIPLVIDIYMYDACVNTKLHLVHNMTVTQMNLKVHVLLVRGNSERLWIFSTKHLNS